MSPYATATGLGAIEWAVDRTWPIKPIVPSAGAGIGTAIGHTRYPFGANSDATWSEQRGSHSGGGNLDGQTAGGVWAAIADGVAGTGAAGTGHYIPQWRPALDPLTCPAVDDPNHRIFWLRLWCLELAAHARPLITDSLGFSLIPDDGMTYSSTTWPPAANGGFGIFRRVGDDGFRWASYAAAATLLEATNLAGGAGWHTADLILRQAVFGDASTPWLTVKWDGVDIIRERPFGGPLLATPQSIRANAHGWAIYYGLQPTDTGRMAIRSRIRIGRFHPDGYLQP